MLFLAFSCAKNEPITNTQSDTDEIINSDIFLDRTNKDVENWTVATVEQLEYLVEIGFVNNSRANSCEWSDGVGGSVDCAGGTCDVVFWGAAGGPNTHVGIGCFKGGVLDHADEFRPL